MIDPRTWPDERTEMMRELWDKGLSALQIAKALNAKFHIALTRNAVIGKVHRSGLRRSTELRRATNAASGRRSGEVRRAKAEAREAQAILRRASRPPQPMPVMHDASFAKPWIERAFGECAYPIAGDGADVISCCAPTEATYCAFHAARMYVIPPTTGKAFVRSLRRYAA